MTTNNTSGSIDIFAALQKLNYVPTLEDVIPSDDADVRQYHKMLRQFFLHEKSTTDHPQINMLPLLAAPYLREELPITDYPLLYFPGDDSLVSSRFFLQSTFHDLFASGEAATLDENLDRFIHLFQQKSDIGNEDDSYDHLIKEIFLDLRASDVKTESLKAFHDQCDELESRLLSKEAELIGYSEATAFQILNLNLKNRNDRNRIFISKLKSSIAGLNDLLLLHEKKTDKDQHHFGFADDLISFDKITSIEVSAISSQLPDARLKRILKSLQILNEALKSYSTKSNLVFVTKTLSEQFNLKETLSEAHLNITVDRSCSEARTYVQIEIQKFVDIVAAIKLAELEISQKYEEKLHAPYFEEFNVSYLSEDDFQFLRTLIVIEESQHMMQHPQDILALISNDAHVKVLGVNFLDNINKAIDDSDEDMYLELASLAIVRRNTFVFQGAPDTPLHLNEAFRRGLDEPFPALWNILLPSHESKHLNSFVALRSAINSRFFPRLVYDVRFGKKFGSHFNITANPQPEHAFPSFDLEINTTSGKRANKYELTIADFFAQDPELLNRLEVVPTMYSNENLMPLHEYLNSSPDAVVARIPFIWLVDDQNNLMKGAVPISWIQRCRARLDYWQFIQELGGVNNYHVQHALDAGKSEWEVLKQEEINEIKSALLTEFESTRNGDLERAIKRMLNRLLDSNNGVKMLSHQLQETVGSTPTKEAIQSQPETESVQEQPEIEIETVVSSDVWVESDECTSCNDCTEALPSVFKYNSDKQAVVHNAKGGTYAKIVAAAEKCPAACIHPGVPKNPNEPNLEKLIKRAEKFN